jgi:hypothetical protein
MQQRIWRDHRRRFALSIASFKARKALADGEDIN